MNFTFEEFNNSKKSGKRNSSVSKTKYFSLENDGDAAIVRFDYESVKDIILSAVHTVEIKKADGKKFFRDIMCLRPQNGEKDTCPMCAAGQKVSSKFYVKLISYEKDISGAVVPVAKIWKRPAGFANTLAALLDEYGNLKDCLFKIKRRGVKLSKDTTYDILTVSSDIYRPETGYVKDFSGFDNFNAEGTVYLVKTEEEMKTFLETGNFPFVKTTRPVAEEPVVSANLNNSSVISETPVVTSTPVAPAAQTVAPVQEQKPVEISAVRPQRYQFY